MAIFRMSFFWRTIDDEGWSENFFIDQPDIGTAQAQMDGLVPLLLALRNPDCTMDYARVSAVTISGDSLPTTVTLPSAGTYTIPAGEFRLEANAAILTLLLASSLTKGHWFVRGLTTAQIKGRELQTESVFDTALAATGTYLVAAAVQVRSVNLPGPPPTYIYTPVTDIAPLRATARKPGRPFIRVRGRR